MKDRKKFALEILLMTAACFWASPLPAEEEGGEKLKPAARTYPPVPDTADDQQNADPGTQTMQPDVQPLIGIQNPTLGTPEIRHSYWVPGFTYSNSVLSKSLSPAANTGWNTSSYVSGDVSLVEAWSHSLLSVNYSGGGFFSTDPLQGNGQYHQLAAAYEIDQRRWQLLFVDQFSYLPQSAFGFGAPTGLALPGITGTLAVPLPGIQAAYIPNQTILTATGPRYSDASAAQLTFDVSRRGSLTLGGIYGTLQFINSGNVNGDSEILNAGYNYAISPRDTIGLEYLFSAYHFSGQEQALGDHVGQFVYGR